MTNTHEADKPGKLSSRSLLAILLLIVSIVIAGWALVTISTESQIPPSYFISLPTTPLSTKGDETQFVSVSAISQAGLAVGVKGYVQTSSGSPIAGATVYVTYYFQGAYRTQAAATKENGYFEILFPMNWTGWLPVTLTYFGDDQHQGLKQVFSVAGENTEPQ